MHQEVGAILLGREQYEVGQALRYHGGDLNQIVAPALDGRGRSCGAEQDRSVMAYSSASSLARCRPDPALMSPVRSRLAKFTFQLVAAISLLTISPDERALPSNRR